MTNVRLAVTTSLDLIAKALQMLDDQSKLSAKEYEELYYPAAHPRAPIQMIQSAREMLVAVLPTIKGEHK